MKDPAEAVEAGVLKVREYQCGPWQAAMCYHIIRAREALCDAFIKTLREAQAAQAARARE